MSLTALAVGIALGWFAAARQTGKAGAMSELLRLQLTEVTAERDSERDRANQADVKRATLEADARSFDVRMNEIVKAKEELGRQFNEIGSKLLGEAQKTFLERANQRFEEAGKHNQEKLKSVLQPVEATLTRYEANLREMEKTRTGAYEGLKEQILLMREGQERVASEANRLRTTLRSSSGSVGRWGEEQCRNVLERAGLQEGIDFEEQISADEHGDRTRPDFIVSLSGGRKLIIDVKCSLDSYFGAVEAQDDASRDLLLNEHAKAIRAHAQGLTRRTYQDRFGGSLSFVVMFIPGENFLHAAIQLDRQLLSWGQDKNVIIVGPTNLVSLALTVASLRGQEKMQARAEEIAKVGRRLYDNLATLGKNSHAMGRSIKSMIGTWNQLVGTLDGNLLSSARKFDDLGLGKASADIGELEPLDGLVREPQRLLFAGEEPQDSEGPIVAAESNLSD